DTDSTKNSDVFGDIKFSETNTWSNIDLNAVSEFVSIESTFSPGTSATAHVEVDRLLSLFEKNKPEIDLILDLKDVCAIGIDFQKGYSIPCIICWVFKHLDINIKEQLSNLFANEFAIVEEIVAPTDADVSSSNNAQNSSFNNNDTLPSGNEKESEEDENDSNYNEKDSGEDNENDSGNDGEKNNENNSDGDGDEGGGNGDINNDSKSITVASFCRAVGGKKKFQQFDIVVDICVKATSVNDKPYKIFDFFVNVKQCGIGRLLSENLHLHGSGYYFDSVSIEVLPVSRENQSNPRMILEKVDIKPIQRNQAIKELKISEKNLGVKGQVSGAGFQVGGSYNIKNTQVNEKNGKWVEDDGTHCGKWHTLNEMNGFVIRITQVVKFKCVYPKTFMKQCPKMAHVLEISFDNFDNLEKYVAKLKEEHYEQVYLTQDIKNRNFHKEDKYKPEGENGFAVTRSFFEINE
ncbi:13940_t:CDS:2, partial [Racocetra persica]